MYNFKVHINFNVKAMSLQRFSAGSKSFQTYLNTSCVSTKCQFPQFHSYRKLLGKQPLSLLSNGCLTYLLHHGHNTERILLQALNRSKLIKPQVARVCLKQWDLCHTSPKCIPLFITYLLWNKVERNGKTLHFLSHIMERKHWDVEVWMYHM